MWKYPTQHVRTASRPCTACPIESTIRCPDVINAAICSTSWRLIARTNARAARSADLIMPPLYSRFARLHRCRCPKTVVILSPPGTPRSEEHTSELQSLRHLVCRLLLEK